MIMSLCDLYDVIYFLVKLNYVISYIVLVGIKEIRVIIFY